MRKDVKNSALFLRCLRDLMMTGVLLSLVSAFIAAYFRQLSIVYIISAVMNSLFLILNIIRLYYFRIGVKSKNAFYFHNLISTAIYCGFPVVLSALVHITDASSSSVLSTIHTYAFFNFKVFHYISYNGITFSIGRTQSALIYSAICFAAVLIFPLFVNKGKQDKKRRRSIQKDS